MNIYITGLGSGYEVEHLVRLFYPMAPLTLTPPEDGADCVWAEQQQMVASGLLRPEIALAWYYDLPAETEADLQAVREKYMPAAKGGEKHE